MADNYLERRREQYEARKAEWLRKKRCHAIKSKPRPADFGKKDELKKESTE